MSTFHRIDRSFILRLQLLCYNLENNLSIGRYISYFMHFGRTKFEMEEEELF